MSMLNSNFTKQATEENLVPNMNGIENEEAKDMEVQGAINEATKEVEEMHENMHNESFSVQNVYIVHASVRTNVCGGRAYGVIGAQFGKAGLDVLTKDEKGETVLQYIEPKEGEDLTYNPMPFPSNYGFLGTVFLGVNYAIMTHVQKFIKKEASGNVTIYVPAYAVRNVWRAIRFANGNEKDLLSQKQIERFSAEDAKGIKEEMEQFVKYYQILKKAGIKVSVNNHEDLDYTILEGDVANLSKYKDTRLAFHNGMASVGGVDVKAKHRINGERLIDIVNDPFGEGKIAVACKDEDKLSYVMQQAKGALYLLQDSIPFVNKPQVESVLVAYLRNRKNKH